MISKLTKEERETHVFIDEITDTCYADTSIPKDMRKFQAQGWEITNTSYYPDGSPRTMRFKAPRRALTIGKANRVKREMSAEQKQAAADRLAEARAKKIE